MEKIIKLNKKTALIIAVIIFFIISMISFVIFSHNDHIVESGPDSSYVDSPPTERAVGMRGDGGWNRTVVDEWDTLESSLGEWIDLSVEKSILNSISEDLLGKGKLDSYVEADTANCKKNGWERIEFDVIFDDNREKYHILLHHPGIKEGNYDLETIITDSNGKQIKLYE